MPEPLVVAFVVGVTPGKWARIWEERMPEHPLQLQPLSPADAFSALEEGTVDLAFVRLPVPDGALSAIPLYEERPVVAMPRDHVLTVLDEVRVSDLADETVLDGDWAADVELVAANVGVAIMPQSVARALSRKDVAVRPAPDREPTRVALVWREDSATELTEEFIGIVRGRTANSSRGGARPAAPQPQRSGGQRKPSAQQKPAQRRRRPKRR